MRLKYLFEEMDLEKASGQLPAYDHKTKLYGCLLTLGKECHSSAVERRK